MNSWEELPRTKKAKIKSLEEIIDRRIEALKQYPSPKEEKIFKSRWVSNIADIVDRDNFKEGHLFQLEVLCDLYVELDDLKTIIEDKGYTYETSSQYGVTEKVRPEVAQKNRVLAEIRGYSKMLGLILVKDQKLKDGEDEDDWD